MGLFNTLKDIGGAAVDLVEDVVNPFEDDKRRETRRAEEKEALAKIRKRDAERYGDDDWF